MHDNQVVRLEDVSRCYAAGSSAQVRALDGISVTFERSTFTAVMGPSGSGKSTLLQCAAGIDRPDSGRVVVDGVDLGPLGEKALTELRRDRIGFIFQASNLIGALTAEQNVGLPLRLVGHAAGPRPGTGSARAGRARRAGRAPALPAVRRPAAACGRRPGPDQPPEGAVRRRTDRGPGQRLQPDRAEAAARSGRRAGADHDHGHSRPGGGLVRGPRHLPRRRPRDRRDARADRAAGGRALAQLEAEPEPAAEPAACPRQ